MASEAERIREPLEYPEHDNSSSEDVLVSEGTITDYITGREVKDSPKERVRQRIERALFHEYGFSTDSMESDFPIPVEVSGKRRRKKVEIAIFDYDEDHTLENLRRVVVCRPEPKNGKKGVTKLRDHEQAAHDRDELKEFMTAVPTCQYGLWTNGLDMFFLRKEITRFDTLFEPRADWPLAEESQGSRSVVSDARLRRADPEMLRMAFRRCHNFIHGNEGMPKDAAFWQFLYLIFAKMHDERSEGITRRFYVHSTEPFTTEGGKAIHARIEPLFAEVKQKYGPASDNPIFRGNEELTLSDRALGFLVAELARYDFARTEIDAKGIADQEAALVFFRPVEPRRKLGRGDIAMNPQAMTLEQICEQGLAILCKHLGIVGLVRFLQQAEMGSGNYTEERYQWLGDPDLEKLAKKIQARYPDYASLTSRMEWRICPLRTQ
jgi:type I restriction enzyme M protein